MTLQQFICKIYDANNKVISSPHFFAKNLRHATIRITEFSMKKDQIFGDRGGKPCRYIISQTHWTDHQDEIIADAMKAKMENT
jgi:hypothetical protein